MIDTADYQCKRCEGLFLLGDGEHINNEFTCHTCLRSIDKSKAEYLCEIASVIWSKNGWLDLDKLQKEDRIEMTYDVWFQFYEYVYKICKESKRNASLLEIIYDEIEDNLMSMFAKFLSTYKK